MAESKKNRENTLTCPICMETFQKPVTLPCQHSFCRECIGVYADKSKPGQTDESCSTGSEGIHQLISCPVCRTSTDIGREGIAGLPPNFHPAEIVEKFSSAVKVEDDIPYCSLCEDDIQVKAVKFCTDCSLLYCKDWLISLHPMRGAMKRHGLISSVEYLAQETTQRQVSRMNNQVSSRHAPETPAVLSRTTDLEKVLQGTKESLSGAMRQRSKLQENQELHIQEVEKAYCAALEALQAWRQQSLGNIKICCSQWSVGFSAILQHFQIQAQEMERMVQASKDLLASVDVEFLQGSIGFTKTIDDQLNEIRADLEKHEDSKQTLLDFVQHDLVFLRHVTVKRDSARKSGHRSSSRWTNVTLMCYQ
ncbi:tripartite motif-containing protein 54-like [Liolophura sinensis]|uniref:tripartite motif-containing protein 54-like n=1 Tax=Liolophura sinensis TaxID=3198878 RepID=UPI0031598439